MNTDIWPYQETLLLSIICVCVCERDFPMDWKKEHSQMKVFGFLPIATICSLNLGHWAFCVRVMKFRIGEHMKDNGVYIFIYFMLLRSIKQGLIQNRVPVPSLLNFPYNVNFKNVKCNDLFKREWIWNMSAICRFQIHSWLQHPASVLPGLKGCALSACVPGSWLEPDPALAAADIWRMNQQVAALRLSASQIHKRKEMGKPQNEKKELDFLQFNFRK